MNLPNRLSLLRIILVPVMAAVYILNWAWAPLAAVVIFIAAACTDFLDGYFARKYNMVTDLGKLLDPIADKLLVLFALFLVVEAGVLPVGVGSICAGVIIGRELLISGVRQIAASKNVIIQANVYGKIKTIFQDISIPMLMLLKMKDVFFGWFSPETDLSAVLYDSFRYTTYALFAAAVLLTVVSGVIYLVQNRRVFADNK